jgi:hypothetical protein
MAKELPITEFDLRTVDESTQMFKAMIPFLDYQLQKPLSLIIRMNEFSQTLRFITVLRETLQSGGRAAG